MINIAALLLLTTSGSYAEDRLDSYVPAFVSAQLPVQTSIVAVKGKPVAVPQDFLALLPDLKNGNLVNIGQSNMTANQNKHIREEIRVHYHRNTGITNAAQSTGIHHVRENVIQKYAFFDCGDGASYNDQNTLNLIASRVNHPSGHMTVFISPTLLSENHVENIPFVQALTRRAFAFGAGLVSEKTDPYKLDEETEIPQIQNYDYGHPMVDLMAYARLFNLPGIYSPETATVRLNLPTTATFTLGVKTFTVAGQTKASKTPPVIYGRSVYIGLDTLSELEKARTAN